MATYSLKIYNGKVITPQGILDRGTLLINRDKIDTVIAGDSNSTAAVEIDAKGNYISPGFIDIHVHGGGGHDFMDNTPEAFYGIANMHARHGTTAMCPTTLTSEVADLHQTLQVYDEVSVTKYAGACFIGMHIEGPYLSMNQRGAQDPRYIRDFDEKEYKSVVAKSRSIRRWSAAPERPGSSSFAKHMVANNILPAIAHSDANYEDVIQSIADGYTHVTHFYSCMSGVTRRNAMRFAGIIESTYLLDELTTEIIVDGVHLPPPLLKLIYKVKGSGKVALITDAMRAAGMGPGESILGSKKNGLHVIVEDGVAKLPDRSSFAGSVATTDMLVRNMITLAGVSLPEAVKMMAHTPAMIMNVADRKGTLEKGKDADVVIFDDNIDIRTTVVGGEIVYKAP
ncbi:MAG TPA: N-acetylglucosamine-6-phosphate deacetylase [Cyclobacteriaceae bacterium]|nr:N-acetylglucosamine-6-phosphate deacetylase [Cyclobacteriaceae bacterium]